MTSLAHYTSFPQVQQRHRVRFRLPFLRKEAVRSPPCRLAQGAAELPRFVRESAVAMRYLRLLGALDWSRFPERDLNTPWTISPVPFAPFVAACLVKLNEQHVYMPQLRDYLIEHPAFI